MVTLFSTVIALILIIGFTLFVKSLGNKLFPKDTNDSEKTSIHPENAIVLTADCFDNVNDRDVTRTQYSSVMGCPVHRAIQKLDPEARFVTSNTCIINGIQTVLDLRLELLEECRKQLANGAEFAYIYKQIV